MTDPIYDVWRDVRRRVLEQIEELPPTVLYLLAAEMRRLADDLADERKRRERAAEKADARLYRPKERP